MSNIINDTIQTGSKLLLQAESKADGGISLWFWIAIIELFIIISLLLFKRKTKIVNAKEQFKKEAKEGVFDFGNIINSSFHVKPLYDELKVKCHPDRFPTDDKMNAVALELFQEISKNKTDYQKLMELKESAKIKLNIKF